MLTFRLVQSIDDACAQGSQRAFAPGHGPYPDRYNRAFAFSRFPYPLTQQIPLRVSCLQPKLQARSGAYHVPLITGPIPIGPIPVGSTYPATA